MAYGRNSEERKVNEINSGFSAEQSRMSAIEVWRAQSEQNRDQRLGITSDNSSGSTKDGQSKKQVQTVMQNGFDPSQTGIPNSTGVSSAQSGGNSFGQGGQGSGDPNGNGGQPSAVAYFSKTARSATGAVPAEVMKGFLSFPDMETPLVLDQDARKRINAAGQIANRHDVHAKKTPEAEQAGTEMGIVMARMETSELQSAARNMAHAPLTKQEPNAEDVSSYTGDQFGLV